MDIEQMNTAEIFFALQKIQTRLMRLGDSGHVRMDTTSDNTDYRSAGKAIQAADTALQTAIDATRWMATQRPPQPQRNA